MERTLVRSRGLGLSIYLGSRAQAEAQVQAQAENIPPSSRFWRSSGPRVRLTRAVPSHPVHPPGRLASYQATVQRPIVNDRGHSLPIYQAQHSTAQPRPVPARFSSAQSGPARPQAAHRSPTCLTHASLALSNALLIASASASAQSNAVAASRPGRAGTRAWRLGLHHRARSKPVPRHTARLPPHPRYAKPAPRLRVPRHGTRILTQPSDGRPGAAKKSRTCGFGSSGMSPPPRNAAHHADRPGLSARSLTASFSAAHSPLQHPLGRARQSRPHPDHRVRP